MKKMKGRQIQSPFVAAIFFQILLHLAPSSAVRICRDLAYIPGTCKAQLSWAQIQNDGTDFDFLRLKLFDASGAKITRDEDDANYQFCTGDNESKCKFASALGEKIYISPQRRIEYVHFYYGKHNWYTTQDKDLKEGEPSYLNNPESAPFCTIADSTTPPDEDNAGYMSIKNMYPEKLKSPDSIMKVSIECNYISEKKPLAV
ncbi:hypothetical protein ABW19_dt0209773 [Dactylella cylindrospora]|nr:hypothetical protein ABW19_dt0209773 [Dactylella cylindrospora]